MENINQTIETLTVEQVAEIFGVTERTIYRRCDANEIPHFRIGETGAIRFVKSKIVQWIEDQHHSSTQ